jgi:hypothetical protein
MRRPFPTAGDVDPADACTVATLLAAGEARRILGGAAPAPPSVLERGHVLEADGDHVLRHRWR